jgi:hypothetical protein
MALLAVYPREMKKQNLGQVWWHMPVVPATREAEGGGSLDPTSLRPAWAT